MIWWRDNLLAWNGRSLVLKCPDIVIETNASSLGWGASWVVLGRLLHINCLGLIAGGFALKSFVKDRCHLEVLLLMDQTSIAYINKMGGTSSGILASLAYQIWHWCLNKDITVVAQHLSGYLNVIADEKSRSMGTSAIGTSCPKCSSKYVVWRSSRNRPFYFSANQPTPSLVSCFHFLWSSLF